MSHSYYTPTDIAAVVGHSPQVVRARLRRMFPRDDRAWWRFTRAEYEYVLEHYFEKAEEKKGEA